MRKDGREGKWNSDDLLEDLDALDELLGPTGSFSARRDAAEDEPENLFAMTPPIKPRRNDPQLDLDMDSEWPGDDNSSADEDDIPVLDDVVYPGNGLARKRRAETKTAPEIPSRAEIESWLDLAVESRLEKIRGQLRREIFAELLRRYPALRHDTGKK